MKQQSPQDKAQAARTLRRRRGLVRDQVVSVDHGTPGGALGAPDSRELRGDQDAHAEKGGHLERAEEK